MKFLLPVFVLISVFIFSCKKQGSDGPSVGTITFTGLHTGDTVKGTLSAQLTTTGGPAINKIAVYANDSLIATINTAPYILTWNSLGVNNGSYKLKAVAYESNGKQAEASLNVVVSNILITLQVDPNINSIYTDIIYVVTDSAGSVLTSVKYNGESTIPIVSPYPDRKSRCSVFEVKTDPSLQTYITGYMSIPKGGVWDLRGIGNTNPDHWYNASLNFTNFPAFSRMIVSTDEIGFSFQTPQQVGNITNYGFSATTKEFVQYVDPSDNGHYGFFPLDITRSATTMSLKDSTFNNSTKKTLTINGATTFSLGLYGRGNDNYYSYYLLDQVYSQSSGLSYFYPNSNDVKDYICNVYYEQNGWAFSTDYASLPPDVIPGFGTAATINNNSLSSFSFTPQGDLDYYSASFSDVADKVYATIFSPSAFTSFKFPQILNLTNIPSLPVSNLKPFSFTMFKMAGFIESKLPYYNPNEFPALTFPSQSATKYF